VKKTLAVAVLIVSMMGMQSYAFDWFGGRLSIGGGFGRVKPKLPYSYQDTYQDGDMWTANAKYFLNNDFSVVASYADLEPYRRGNNLDTFRFRPIVGSIRYNFIHHLPFTPYLTLGAGYSTNKHEVPGQPTVKWDGLALQGGLGLEFFITEGTSIGAEALYHNFAAEGNKVPYRLVSAVGMVNIYFGAGPTQKRTEEALEQQKAAAAAAQAQAAAAQQQTTAAQQQALTAQQQQAQSAAAAATAQQQAQQAQQQAQQQVQEAQQEVEQIKQLVATKQTSPIAFKTGSADLLATSNATLDKVADIAKKYPQLKLRVEGYTDNVGGDDYNQSLSEKRANSVMTYLTSTGGVPAGQVTAVGYGKGHPIASNDTSAGRAQNRRVEFVFFI
jgi:outer membrane protein OmpA-like peptidoglycan-associated protein